MVTMQSQMGRAGQASKVIDWEALHYALLDHRVLHDPNPERRALHQQLYNGWIEQLHGAIEQGTLHPFSRDGHLTRRLNSQHALDGDALIGLAFRVEDLMANFSTYARAQVAGSAKIDSKVQCGFTLLSEALADVHKGLASLMPGEVREVPEKEAASSSGVAVKNVVRVAGAEAERRLER